MRQRCLFVRLVDGLDFEHQEAVFSAIKLFAGVELVVDMSVVSRETLESVLLSTEETIDPKKPRRRLSK